MLEAIRDHYERTGPGRRHEGRRRRATEQGGAALSCWCNETLGAEWLTPERLPDRRLVLLNDILMQCAKTRPGATAAARTSPRMTVEPRSSDRLGLRARARVARPRPAARALRPVHRRRVLRAAPSALRSDDHPGDEEPLAEVARAGPADVARGVAAARAALAPLVGAARQRARRSTCSGSRGCSRSARASSRCSSR